MYMDKHLPYILAFADIQKIHVVLDMIIKQPIREVEQVTERLTQKTDEGILVKESHGENVIKTLYQCYGAESLPDYSNCDEGYLAMEKLLEYESAEEDGRLVVLPCKVGSTVYLICHRYTKCSKYGESFEEYSCSGCEEWECDSHKEYYIHVNQSVSLEWIVRNMRLDTFGKTIFLTKEVAEKALKEMQTK